MEDVWKGSSRLTEQERIANRILLRVYMKRRLQWQVSGK